MSLKDRMHKEQLDQYLNGHGAAVPEMSTWVKSNHMARLFHLADKSRTDTIVRQKRNGETQHRNHSEQKSRSDSDEIQSKEKLLFQAFLESERQETLRLVREKSGHGPRDEPQERNSRSEHANRGSADVTPIPLLNSGAHADAGFDSAPLTARSYRDNTDDEYSSDSVAQQRLVEKQVFAMHEVYENKLDFEEKRIYGPTRPSYAQHTPRSAPSTSRLPRAGKHTRSNSASGSGSTSPRDPFGLEAEKRVEARRKIRIKFKAALDTGSRTSRPKTAPVRKSRQQQSQRGALPSPRRPKTATEKMHDRKKREQEEREKRARRRAKAQERAAAGAPVRKRPSAHARARMYTNEARAAAESARQDKLNRICLFAAIDKGDVAGVARLLKQRVDVSSPIECHPDLMPPVQMAIARKRVEIARMLIGANANLNRKDGHGATALMTAIEWDSPELAIFMLQVLVGNGEKAALDRVVTTPNAAGNLPIHAAAMKGYADVVTSLLDRGAKPNALSKAGFSPAALVCQQKLQQQAVGNAEHVLRVLSDAGGRVVAPGGRASELELVAQLPRRSSRSSM